jgi:uncharacterized protein YndB with AHSA1/START domain
MIEHGDISEQAVQKETGWTWDEWFSFLDKEGAKDLTHKEIAKLLREDGQVKSGWWQQMITVEYERSRGIHKANEEELAEGDFEVSIRRTFEVSPKRAWDVLLKPVGQKLWLEVLKPVKFEKGQTYEAMDGTVGEVLTVRPGSHIRLTWRPMGWQEETTVQVSIIDTARKAVIMFHQEKLPTERDRENLRLHWGEVLDRLGEVL